MSGKEHKKNQHTVPKCYLKAWAHGEKIWVLDTKTKIIEEKGLDKVTVIQNFYEPKFSSCDTLDVQNFLIEPIKRQIDKFPKQAQTFLNKKERFPKFLESLEDWKNNPQNYEKILDNLIETKFFEMIENHAGKVLTPRIHGVEDSFHKLQYEEKLSLCLLIASQHQRSKWFLEGTQKDLGEQNILSQNLCLLIPEHTLSLSNYFFKCMQQGKFELFKAENGLKNLLTCPDPVRAYKHESMPSLTLQLKKFLKKNTVPIDKARDEKFKISEESYLNSVFFFPLTPNLELCFPAQKGKLKSLSEDEICKGYLGQFLERKEIFAKEKADLEIVLSVLQKQKRSF